MSMPSIEAGPGWPTWFHTKSSPPKALAVRRTMARAKSSWRRIADKPQRPAAGSGDLADDGVDPGLVDVDDADRRTLAGKAQRARPCPSPKPPR